MSEWCLTGELTVRLSLQTVDPLNKSISGVHLDLILDELRGQVPLPTPSTQVDETNVRDG